MPNLFEDIAEVGFSTEGTSLDDVNSLTELLEEGKVIGDDPTGSQPEQKEGEEKKTDEDKDKKEVVEEKKKEDPEEDDKKSDDGKDLPFHKHPRWKKMREENKELRDFKENTLNEIKTLKDQVSKLSKSNSDEEELPKDFVEKFGHDFDTWEKVKDKWTKEEPKQKEEEINDERVKNYEKKIDNIISDIEEDFEVDLSSETGKKTKNEFFSFMKEYQPTSNGSLDFTKGWKLFSKSLTTNKVEEDKNIEAKKNVAKNLSSKSSGSDKNGKSINFRTTSWDDL